MPDAGDRRRSPADCFDVAQEAWRIAVRYMTPVMLLTDGYIANGSEPWRIPNVADLPKIEIKHPARRQTATRFMPYKRDERLARPWAIPGTPGLEHRIGGLEKQDITGNMNYDPANHQHMVNTRAAKVANIANDIPPQKIDGPASGDLLVAELGRHLRRVRHGRPHTCRPKAKPCHTLPPAVPQSAAEGPGRHPEAIQEGAHPRAEPGPTSHDHPRQVPDRRDRPQQSPRQAVQRRRSRRSQDREACSRGDTKTRQPQRKSMTDAAKAAMSKSSATADYEDLHPADT